MPFVVHLFAVADGIAFVQKHWS